MHVLSYPVVLEFEVPRIREANPLQEYRSKDRRHAWTEQELAHIRLILRKLTALRVENPEDAEDLVQETLLTMIRKAPEINLEKGPLVWAMGILRKKVGNYYRRPLRCIPLEDHKPAFRAAWRGPAASPNAEADLHYAELCSVVDNILRKLPAGEHKAIWLYLTGAQTGEIVSLMSPERYQNIVNRIHRGRKKLVRELARYGYARSELDKPR